MAENELPEFPLAPEIGKPLARLVDERGARVQYGYSSHLLSTFLDAGMPMYVQQRDHAVRSDAIFNVIAARAIERLDADKTLHKRVRDLVKSEEFRRQFVHDNLTLTIVGHIEFARAVGGPDDSLLKLTGIEPYHFATAEERTTTVEAIEVGVLRQREDLENAYIDFVVGIVTGKIGAADAGFGPALIPRVKPLPSSSFKQDRISIINSPHTIAAIGSILSGADAWTRGEYQPSYKHTNGVTVYAQTTPHFNEQAIDDAFRLVLTLNDNHVSAFLICMGKWIAESSGDTNLPKTRITVSDLLDFRDIKKHHKGGYRRAQKEEAKREVLDLNSLWVRSLDTIYEKPGRTKVVPVDSRLLEVAIESQPDLFGNLEPYAFRIAPGDWAREYLTGHNVYIATLLRQVMRYKPSTDQLPMRLGIYLTPQWRNRANTRNYDQAWRIDTLLDGAFIKRPAERKHYRKFQENIEAALDRLQADGVIARWEYKRHNMDDLFDRGWFERWLEWTVQILPPPEIVEQYASIADNRNRAIGRSKRASAAALRRSEGKEPPPHQRGRTPPPAR